MAKKTLPPAVTTKNDILNALASYSATYQERSDAGSGHSNTVAALKKKGINTEAFALAFKLKGMDPLKAASYLRSFREYTDALGVNDQTDFIDELERIEEATEE